MAKTKNVCTVCHSTSRQELTQQDLSPDTRYPLSVGSPFVGLRYSTCSPSSHSPSAWGPVTTCCLGFLHQHEAILLTTWLPSACSRYNTRVPSRSSLPARGTIRVRHTTPCCYIIPGTLACAWDNGATNAQYVDHWGAHARLWLFIIYWVEVGVLRQQMMALINRRPFAVRRYCPPHLKSCRRLQTWQARLIQQPSVCLRIIDAQGARAANCRARPARVVCRAPTATMQQSTKIRQN